MKETSVTAFLTKVGLKKSDSKLVEDKFDIDTLMRASDEDLLAIGLPLVPRFKLLRAVHEQKDKHQQLLLLDKTAATAATAAAEPEAGDDSNPTLCTLCKERAVECRVSCDGAHAFCVECVFEWTRLRPTCPSCRSPISAELVDIKTGRRVCTDAATAPLGTKRRPGLESSLAQQINTVTPPDSPPPSPPHSPRSPPPSTTPEELRALPSNGTPLPKNGARSGVQVVTPTSRTSTLADHADAFVPEDDSDEHDEDDGDDASFALSTSATSVVTDASWVALQATARPWAPPMMLHSPQLQSLPYLSSPPPPMLLLPSGTPMCPISCHARYLGRIVYISQAYAFIRRDDPEGAALDDIFLYLKELEYASLLQRGDTLSFEYGVYKGRPKAIEVLPMYLQCCPPPLQSFCGPFQPPPFLLSPPPSAPPPRFDSFCGPAPVRRRAGPKFSHHVPQPRAVELRHAPVATTVAAATPAALTETAAAAEERAVIGEEFEEPTSAEQDEPDETHPPLDMTAFPTMQELALEEEKLSHGASVKSGRRAKRRFFKAAEAAAEASGALASTASASASTAASATSPVSTTESRTAPATASTAASASTMSYSGLPPPGLVPPGLVHRKKSHSPPPEEISAEGDAAAVADAAVDDVVDEAAADHAVDEAAADHAPADPAQEDASATPVAKSTTPPGERGTSPSTAPGEPDEPNEPYDLECETYPPLDMAAFPPLEALSVSRPPSPARGLGESSPGSYSAAVAKALVPPRPKRFDSEDGSDANSAASPYSRRRQRPPTPDSAERPASPPQSAEDAAATKLVGELKTWLQRQRLREARALDLKRFVIALPRYTDALVESAVKARPEFGLEWCADPTGASDVVLRVLKQPSNSSVRRTPRTRARADEADTSPQTSSSSSGPRRSPPSPPPEKQQLSDYDTMRLRAMYVGNLNSAMRDCATAADATQALGAFLEEVGVAGVLAIQTEPPAVARKEEEEEDGASAAVTAYKAYVIFASAAACEAAVKICRPLKLNGFKLNCGTATGLPKEVLKKSLSLHTTTKARPSLR